MEVEFLGGAREVGRSAVLVDDALLIDYGLLTADPPQYPLRDPEPDAVVVSHGHLDHVGAVPALLKGDRRPTIHWTPPTAAIARVLARDTLKLHGNSPLCPFSEEHVARLGEVEERHTYAEPFVVEAAGPRTRSRCSTPATSPDRRTYSWMTVIPVSSTPATSTPTTSDWCRARPIGPTRTW